MSSQILRRAQGAALPGLCLILGLMLAACSATVTHRQESTNATGIRYYRNAPYLLIYSDGKGGLRWQILYLPDQSQVMTATPDILGGRTEMTLMFQNGALSSASVTGDTTAIPKAIIAAIQSALPLIGKAFAAAAPLQPGFPAPYLYKIVTTGNMIDFVGGQGDTAIEVPINGGETP